MANPFQSPFEKFQHDNLVAQTNILRELAKNQAATNTAINGLASSMKGGASKGGASSKPLDSAALGDIKAISEIAIAMKALNASEIKAFGLKLEFLMKPFISLSQNPELAKLGTSIEAYSNMLSNLKSISTDIGEVTAVVGKIPEGAFLALTGITRQLSNVVNHIASQTDTEAVKAANDALNPLNSMVTALGTFSSTMFSAGISFLKVRPIIGLVSSSIVSVIEGFNTKVVEKLGIKSDDAIDAEKLKGIEFINKLATAIVGAGEAILKAGPIYMKARVVQKVTAGFISTTIENWQEKVVEAIDLDSINDGAEKLNKMSEALITFGKNILIMAPIYLAAAVVVVPAMLLFKFTSWVFQKLGKRKEQKAVDEGTDTMKSMALAIGGFALAMLAAGATVIFGWKVIMAGLALVGLGIALIVGLSKLEDSGKEASKTLLRLAFGIGIFALSLWAFKMSKVELMDGLILSGLVLMVAGTFWLVGKLKTEVAKGALAMIIVGLALIPFSLGLVIFKKANFEFIDIAILGLTIFTVGAMMALAGLVAPNIALGAGAMIVAAVGVIALAGAAILWKKTDFEMQDVLVLGATVGMITLTFGLAGLASLFILLGSFALTISAIPIAILSFALKYFKSTGWNLDDVTVLGATLGTVIKSFAEAGLKSLVIIPGALGLAIAGASLWVIGWGLGKFREQIGTWTEEDSTSLELALGSLRSAFGGGGGILKGIYSFATGAVDSAAILANAIGLGIGAAALGFAVPHLQKARELNWQESDSLSVEMAISSVKTIFGGGGGFLKGISNFAGGLIDGATAKITADTLRNNAVALVDIVRKLQVAKELNWTAEHSKGTEMAISTLKTIFGGGKSVVGAAMGWVSSSFDAKTAANTQKSLLGSANVLLQIGEALRSFTNMNIPIDKLTGPDGQISLMLGTITDAFAKIGDQNVGLVFDSDMEDGIEALMGLGEIMGGIGQGLQGMAAMDAADIGPSLNSLIASISKVNTIDKGSIRKFDDLLTAVSSMSMPGDMGNLDQFGKMSDGIDKVAKSLNTINLERVNGVSKMFENMGYVADRTIPLQEAIEAMGAAIESSVAGMGNQVSESITGAPAINNEVTVSAAPTTNKDVVDQIKAMNDNLAGGLGKISEDLKGGIDVEVTKPGYTGGPEFGDDI